MLYLHGLLEASGAMGHTMSTGPGGHTFCKNSFKTRELNVAHGRLIPRHEHLYNGLAHTDRMLAYGHRGWLTASAAGDVATGQIK